jgi:hypothetical protein
MLQYAMLKISDTVLQVVNEDEITYEAFRQGLLSFNSYARKIKSIVEDRTMKEIKVGTIVVALSRLKNRISDFSPIKPSVKVQNINLKSPLCETTYEKTIENIQSATKLSPYIFKSDEFFTVTYGVNEITLIYPQMYQEKIQDQFNTKPKGEYNNLGAITVRFSEKDYIEVPNMVHTLVSALAIKRINLIEIVSTFSEISFIVRMNEVNKTIEALQQFLN